MTTDARTRQVMNPAAVRIPPVAIDQLNAEQSDAIGAWTHLIFSRVLVNAPRMYRSFVGHLEELVARSKLPMRGRQIVCLRMLEDCGDVYEQTHHVVISRKCGLKDEEIAAMIAGEGEALTDFDRVVIKAVDELHRDQFISDATWAALAEQYSQEELMELVFLAGCYLTMGMLTKSFGIQLELDLESFNALRAYAD
jgi:4-carboxymuconolactone decarboxylase